jgi:lysyl-tRNA synthetase class 2
MASIETTLTPSQYKELRLQYLSELDKKGIINYPHVFTPTISIAEYRIKYDSLKNEETNQEDMISVSGRILTVRCASSNKLYFIDIASEDDCSIKLQVMANVKLYDTVESFGLLVGGLRRGDIIGITGRAHRTKKGELSIIPNMIILLAPSLHVIPEKLLDSEIRHRQRYLDLIINDEVKDRFIQRSNIIRILRRFLEDKRFIEVETPILQVIPGGANAKPFKTHHNEHNLDMHLRIAPELSLKMLVIGGIQRVFEIGKNFRNEGVDHTHNPEYTSCELYASYMDYKQLMDLTEELLVKLITHGENTTPLLIKYSGSPTGVIDFTPPYRRISIMSELEKRLGIKFPSELGSEESATILKAECIKNNVNCSAPQTIARMIDKLVAHFIEPECINPTFLCDHPVIMSPLAKTHRTNPNLTERFELFVNCRELCNAYTELNDPKIQRERFMEQAKDKNSGDTEAQILDEDFCEALEYGLPPCGGWGIGIDRLVMLLTNQTNIREVILFPTMKPNH